MKQLDDVVISRAIFQRYYEDLMGVLESDVAIAGGGPSGLTAAYYLSKAGKKVTVFERKLSTGGGMWGGGMMFNQAVIQEEALPILDDFGICYTLFKDNYFTINTVEAVAALTLGAIRSGAKIMNLLSVEDVMVRDERITGLVLNWAAVEIAGLHVDPVTVRSPYVIDCTGHDAQVVAGVVRKMGTVLNTTTGKMMGEKSMWADKGESALLENTKEVYPGLYVAGMAANAVYGSYRMGPIFGGMLLSGKKVAEIIGGKINS